MNKYISLFIAIILIAALIGCHAGGSSPMAPDNSATILTPETRTVDKNGKFTDIIFPSGAVIKCPNDDTFKEGVKVTASEEKVPVITDNSGKFSYIYVYNISAVLPSENSLTADVPVNTIEKPLSVTLPNNSTDGTCYIGTRANENDPWHYSLVTDGTTSNVRFMRLSTNPPKSCIFSLYRLNIQFRLFVFDNEEKNDEVQVDRVTLTPAEDVEIKNGKYTGKLSVKLNVEGENLNGIKAENLIAKIIYRSENQQGANIDFASNKTDSSDKAVTGGYEHSFEISNIKVENSLGNTAELSFELNLDGISLEEFPTDFLVEFYSKGSDENLRPFEYTQTFEFETKEQTDTQTTTDTDTNTNTESGTDTQTNTDSGTETDTESSTDTDSSTETGSSTDTGSSTGTDTSVEIYSITYDLDGGEPTKDNPSNYTAETESFTLNNPTKTGFTFTGWTGTDLDSPTKEVTIKKGSTGDRSYKANWKQNAPEEYTLNLIKGDGIATVTGEGTYKESDSVTASCTMLEGYEFDSWSGDFTKETFTMPAKDVTMTANAKPIQYKITLDAKGGTLEKNSIEYNIVTEEFNLPVPNKNGYDFTGWTGSNGDTPQRVVKIEKGTTGNKTYTANYSAVAFTITYTLGADDVINDNPTGFNPDTETFKLKEPERTGYTFTGWTGSNGNTPQKEVTISKGSTENKSYTANWNINSYNLTINKGTGINTVSGAGSYEYNSSVTASCTMIAGYEFDKWTGDFTTETFVMPVKDVTLTANAKVITYSIAYNLDGGQLTKDNPENYTVETESITLINPTKDNFTFLGWTYEGQTTPQTTVSINTGSTGDKIFTANWEAKAVVSLKSTADELSGSNIIKLEFDKEITWQNSYANNITITPTTTSTPITASSFSYSNKTLTITLSDKLKYNTEYKVAVADMPKVVDKNLTFTTAALTVTPQIASIASDIVVVNEVNRHILQPTFTIDFGKEIVNKTTAKNSILLNTDALPNSCNLAFDENGKIATLTFIANLELFTDYSLSITAFTDDDNSAVTAQSLSFKTIPPDDILGEGSENKPFLIYTQAHLNKLRENSPINYIRGNYYFKQMDDIVLTSDNWIPIGKENYDDFYGKYDGNNHKITNLKIDNNGDSYAGLFYNIIGNNSNQAEIKNLTIENSNISNGSSIGVLAGFIKYTDISNVYISSINIIDCGEKIGGLAGEIHNSTISNVHLSGKISIKGSYAVGGLAGQCNEVQITACSVDSPDSLVSADTGRDVGGLVGQFYSGASGNSNVSKSYASIKVQGNNCVGGLVGNMNKCTIENSYSRSAITALDKDQYNGPNFIGGLVGSVNPENASFNNCYSKGTIYINAPESKKASNVGGLAGILGRTTQTLINSTNSFSSVTISVSQGYTGDGANHPYNPDDEHGSIPLYYKDYGSGRGYIYEDDTNHNYLSNGYPANKLNWDASVWDNLTDGGYPTPKQN